MEDFVFQLNVNAEKAHNLLSGTLAFCPVSIRTASAQNVFRSPLAMSMQRAILMVVQMACLAMPLYSNPMGCRM